MRSSGEISLSAVTFMYGKSAAVRRKAVEGRQDEPVASVSCVNRHIRSDGVENVLKI